jgi:hypothetical protein
MPDKIFFTKLRKISVFLGNAKVLLFHRCVEPVACSPSLVGATLAKHPGGCPPSGTGTCFSTSVSAYFSHRVPDPEYIPERFRILKPEVVDLFPLLGRIYVPNNKQKTVFRIRDILVRIRIRRSVHLTNGSGSCSFRQ